MGPGGRRALTSSPLSLAFGLRAMLSAMFQYVHINVYFLLHDKIFLVNDAKFLLLYPVNVFVKYRFVHVARRVFGYVLPSPLPIL